MTHCAKCGAELIGTRKFCTACGAPAGDPRSPAASTGMNPVSPRGPSPSSPHAGPASSPGSSPGSSRPGGGIPDSVRGGAGSGPSIQYAPSPASQVNPFAQTAGPKSMPVISASDYGPPPSVPFELASTTPGVGDPARNPQVSPLAVSNVDSQGGPMFDAMASARASTPDDSQQRRAIPGTQLMPSVANPAVGPASSVAGPGVPRPAAAKRPGTQLMAPSQPAQPVAPVASAPAQQPQTAPQPPTPTPHSGPGVPLPMGAGMPLPSPHQGWNPAPYHAPPAPPAPPAPAPAPPAHAPYAPPAVSPAPPYGYGYTYPPGARVNVTWSNGQRYQGTVQQAAGSQLFVVFPDGQGHWVDMQYVLPT